MSVTDKPGFVLETFNRNVRDDDLIADLHRVAALLAVPGLTGRMYAAHGRYSVATIERHLGRGSWNEALLQAGLSPQIQINLSGAELFDNLKQMWITLGRQPRRHEMVRPRSKYSSKPYLDRFGSWGEALRSFIRFVESEDISPSESAVVVSRPPSSRASPRDPNLRLRFQVMRRDRFRCVVCGRSPATNLEVILHVDHVVPWSKGGPTSLENLRTLCATCNVGKGDEL